MRRPISRRHALQGAGGLALSAALSGRAASQDSAPPAPAADAVEPPRQRSVEPRVPDLTGRLARYMAAASARRCRPHGAAAKQRILDTLAAIVSGARSSPASSRSTTCAAKAAARKQVGHDRHRHHGGQRRVCARHVRARGRDRRLPSVHEGASGLLGRTRGARDGRARAPLGRRAVARSDARLRLVLPLPDGARARGAARERSQHRRHQRDVRRDGCGRASRVRTRRGCVTRSRTPCSKFRRLELGTRRGARRESLRLRRHGRAQRRGRGNDDQGGFTGVWTRSRGTATCSTRSARSRSPRRWWPIWARGSIVEETAIKTFPVGYPIQAPLDAFLTLRRGTA